jgi:pilin isopeptide linkage protein/fimbrial isopeptide formation D2 family protein
MIKKSDGTGTPSDIKWTVTLNNGDIKTDMNGYTFTDTLDKKQKYIGSYTVYKGLNKSEKVDEGDLSNSAETFSYTFRNLKEAEKYQPYQIEYHTQMTDQNSYDPVTNTAEIKREGTTSPSGTSTATFRRGIVEQLITKELESHDENGNATWITHVKIPETVDVSQVQILDTFKSTYLQHLKVESLAVKIGDTTLSEGTSTSGDYYFYTRDEVTKGNKINFNIQLRATETVMRELRANGYQIDVVYTTATDNLDGQYWNLAAVQFPFAGKDFKQYSSEPYYIVNNSETPDVDKSSDGYTWDGKFDWSKVEPGSTEKGAWIATWTVYANRYKTPANEFYGAGKLDGKPITIKDTLPADGTMSFVPGSATYTLYANPYDERKEAEREVATNLDVEGSVSGNEVTFSIPTTALGKYAGYAKLTYKTAIKRSVLNTSTNSTTLKNSASAESGSKTFDSGSGTVTIKNNVLQKTGEQVVNSNRIKYTIWVNESAVDLKSGSDFLELVDVMDAKCTLVTDSVKVYQYDGEDCSLLGSNRYSVGAETIPDQSGSACTKMTLTVPDEKYLKVEYEVIPAGNTGEHVSLTSKAFLKGVFEGDAGHTKDWEIQKLNGSAVGSGGGITVTKVDASDITKRLPDAVFKLYEVNMDEALKSGVDGAMTEFQEVTTNRDGEAAFGSEGNKMKAYTLYCLKETTAPEGYTAISEPIWIMLKGQDEQQYRNALAEVESLKQVCDVVKTPTANTAIMVSDEPYSGQAEISATKVLQGSALQQDQFEFVLKDANRKVLRKTKNGANGNINFVLDYTKTGTYKYFISEVIPEGAENNVKDHIAYDTTEHEVEVVVTNGEGKLNATVTYDGTSSTPPTFTNRYSTTLPEAGGAGLTMTYLAGASLLCFAATWMHARRHRDQGRGGSRE